jgi:ATP-binding cassette, subfamily B, bacterial
MSFPFYKQLDAMDCGPSCLRMIAKHYGKTYSLQALREKSFITREGVSLLGISDAAESIGFRTIGVKVSFQKLIDEAPFPCIVHWKQQHFVVVYKIEKARTRITRMERKNSDKISEDSSNPRHQCSIIHVADPAHGLIKYTEKEFLAGWLSTKTDHEDKGIALLIEPSPDFYTQKGEEDIKKTNLKFFFRYLKPYKKSIVQLFLGLLIGSLLQLIFPFLTQSIVDTGISNQNMSFITLILIAQIVLMVSRMSVEFIRGWILLHLSTRINISIISDFLIKLMKLPIGFFDSKMIGDTMQRIGDHSRIENFLTSSTLNTLFSLINLVIFGIVLGVYNFYILGIFILGSALYLLWVTLFLKKRRELDFKRFAQLSENQSNLFQLITGMQEIKLNNCEKQKRWEWEQIQAKLFRTSIKGLALSQYQQVGAVLINETKNIFITFFAAYSVIQGSMTLGMMLAVQYIIGQLNSPIDQLINFMQSAQDAKISLERLGEIHNRDDEEKDDGNKINIFPEDKTIKISDLSFQYDGPHSEMVLENIDLIIPENKITAIVGTSGSGKTTLIKLLLGFYPATKGEIRISDSKLENFNSKAWRQKCGSVMQDGFIFSDTIAQNIALSDETIDKAKLLNAVKMANIRDFVESLPLSYNTKIGQEGHGLSQGQKQRILIARAIYKNPEYIFFDEATNALDANNEKAIMENLDMFFKGRTVVVVAHRLSTVKNADQIIVLEKGKIVEIGAHGKLTMNKGAYYELVKNQLELGN